MASYANFQTNDRKYAGINKPESITKSEEIKGEWEERLIDWITFYRKNMHLFVEHYFGVELKPFQKIWFYQISTGTISMTIASRNIAKSWIIALYGCARCVLYPGTVISIAAGTKGQAGIIIQEKIEEFFRSRYPNINREIKHVINNNQKTECAFHNSSIMRVVVADDNARGHRTQINIYEEFRVMKQDILERVFTAFKTPRQPPYLSNPKYAHLTEEPIEIYISSAYYKHEWWYDKTKKILEMTLTDETVKFIAFDYLLVVKSGFKTKKQIDQERQLLGDISFMMEYENIPFGENENSFFKLSMFSKNRKIKKAFYPRREFDDHKKANPYQIKRQREEIRIVSVDIAMRKNEQDNDNTIITCMRLLPQNDGFQRDVVYMETKHGENTIKQALRIKQIYYEFGADYCVLDIANAGIGVYDQLGTIIQDENTGDEYPAWTVMQHAKISNTTYMELLERTKSLNAIPVVFPISATLELNDEIARDLKDRLNRGMISFLVDEVQGENYVINNIFKSNTKKTTLMDITDQHEMLWWIHPYAQITEAVNEIVNLEYKVLRGYIQLFVAVRTARKDRYSSVSYGNYFATVLELDLLKEKKQSNKWEDYVCFGNADYESNFY